MAIKQLGAAESGASDAATKGYVDAQLQAADGDGLTNSGNVLNVVAGTGITVNANDVALASTVAGDGLTHTTGVLAVGAGTGITVAANDVAVTAAFRTIPIAFHLPGSLSTGVKTPEFIAPVAGTITPSRARVSAGTGVTYRLVKNGASNMDTSAAISTTVVSTTLSTNNTVAAGDRVQLEVVNAGSGASNLSVTAAMLITGA